MKPQTNYEPIDSLNRWKFDFNGQAVTVTQESKTPAGGWATQAACRTFYREFEGEINPAHYKQFRLKFARESDYRRQFVTGGELQAPAAPVGAVAGDPARGTQQAAGLAAVAQQGDPAQGGQQDPTAAQGGQPEPAPVATEAPARLGTGSPANGHRAVPNNGRRQAAPVVTPARPAAPGPRVSDVYRLFLKPAHLNPAGENVTIATAAIEEIHPRPGETKKAVILSFVGRNRQLVLNQSGANRLADLAGDELAGWPGVVISLKPAQFTRDRQTIVIGPPIE